MLSALALRTGSFRTALGAKQTQKLLTRLIRTTPVLKDESPEACYLYRKPETKEVVLTDEEQAVEIARKLRTWETAHEIFYGPERDLKNFPHPKMVDVEQKNHLGFIPHSWFKACYPKLGVTGPYILTWGLIVILHSKEIMVMDHQYPELPGYILLLLILNRKYGPRIAAALDKKTEDEDKARYDEPLAAAKEKYNVAIKAAEEELWRQEAVPLIFQAKKENVALQLESQYRERLHQAHSEVKKRLDYQLEVENTKRQFEQKHMVNWIVNNVIKSITPQQEKESISNCIQTLKAMSATAAV